MMRHVSAVAIALCLSVSSVSAQTAAAQTTALTVKVPSADIHKFPISGSPVIGKVQLGSELEITRNLGYWVEVRYPGGDNGVGFLLANEGSIAGHSGSASPRSSAVGAAPSSSTSRITATATSFPDQRPTPRPTSSAGPSYVSLPHHFVGLGARMGVSTPAYGATGRVWSHHRFGVQMEMTHDALDSIDKTQRLTSTRFSPSVLYAVHSSVNDSLWLRPYVGGGLSFYRATMSTGITSPEDAKETGRSFQAFGGAEMTFSGAPRLALSLDAGYRRLNTSFGGFEPKKIGFSLAGHWYVK
jgi:Outer membrane protein beta-barrel domain